MVAPGSCQSQLLSAHKVTLFPVWLLALLAAFTWFGPSATAEPTELLERGEKIFQSQCASCHGAQGQGVEDYYPDPLVGDSSIGQLQEIVAETMPEEDPETVVGEDALAVASYMHEQFYSEAARIRNRPPRQSLQRLTGNQLRRSLTDLYAAKVGWHTEPYHERTSKLGLEASYYNGKGWKKEDRKIDRIDPVVDFDFGTEGPGKGIDGKSFHAHWSGGLRIDQTGVYEIVVRSITSFTCNFGHHKNQLIDNHVQSEGRNEFRRKLLLTAGSIYPIQIDLNQRKRKGETPPSSISLSWIRPGGVEEIIPATHLRPGWCPGVLRLETKMPPDDRSYGFERGIAVDKTWDQAVTAAALEFGAQAADELWPDFLNRNKKDKRPRAELLTQFLTELIVLAERAGESPNNASEIIAAARKSHEDESDIIKHAMLMTIKSPRFLYPSLDADRSQSQRTANRLSLVLHDSLPIDQWLLDQAKRDQLQDEKQIRQAAERLVDDTRTRAKLAEMFQHWLQFSPDDDLRKSEERFPGFDAQVVHDLRRSLQRYLNEVAWSETSDFRQLVQGDWTFTNDRLAKFYGKAMQVDPADQSFAKVDGQPATDLRRSKRDAQVHVGVLTHPLVMTKFAHHEVSSPIHRGVFLVRHVLGRTLRPPNAAFAPLSPDLHPDLTTRQRIELQTSPDSCQVCHAKINPLGFAFEQFDAVGRFRQKERDKTIDATGYYLTREDDKIEFTGARELGDFIASSPDAETAFVSRCFQYFTKQPIAAYGVDRLQTLTDQFRQNGFNIRKLLVEIAVIASKTPPAADVASS